MQDLEESGLLAAPHTSAGRIPTESGLRLFVDGDHAGRRAARRGPRGDRGADRPRRPDRGGDRNATAALSGLSACAGIVLVPKEEPALSSSPSCRLSPTPGGGGGGRQRRQRRESGGRPAAGRRPPRRWPRSAIMSARASPASPCARRRRGSTEEIGAGKAALDKAAQALVARGLALWSRGRRAPAGADRARPGQSDRRAAPPPISTGSASCSTSSRARRRSPACSTAPAPARR